MKKKINIKENLVGDECENKENGQQTSKVWDPGKMQKTIKQHKINRSGHKHNQIWDPGGLQQIE